MKKKIEKINKENASTIKDCIEVERTGRHKYSKRKNGNTICNCGRIIDIDEKVSIIAIENIKKRKFGKSLLNIRKIIK